MIDSKLSFLNYHPFSILIKIVLLIDFFIFLWILKELIKRIKMKKKQFSNEYESLLFEMKVYKKLFPSKFQELILNQQVNGFKNNEYFKNYINDILNSSLFCEICRCLLILLFPLFCIVFTIYLIGEEFLKLVIAKDVFIGLITEIKEILLKVIFTNTLFVFFIVILMIFSIRKINIIKIKFQRLYLKEIVEQKGSEIKPIEKKD